MVPSRELVRFSTDRRHLWVGDEKGSLTVFDLQRLDLPPRAIHAHDGWITGLELAKTEDCLLARVALMILEDEAVS